MVLPLTVAPKHSVMIASNMNRKNSRKFTVLMCGGTVMNMIALAIMSNEMMIYFSMMFRF